MLRNLTLFLMLLTITVILLSGCSTNSNKKATTFPFSILKKVVIGLD